MITSDIMKKSDPSCFWYVDEPRTLPDGRLTASKEVDNHPMLLNEPMMKESHYVNMAVFEWLLER